MKSTIPMMANQSGALDTPPLTVRETDDLRIPGFARSARQREIDAAVDPDAAQPRGRVPNTASSTTSAKVFPRTIQTSLEEIR